MRNTEQRVLAVRARKAELKREQRRTWIGYGFGTICLALSVGLALMISGMHLEGVGAKPDAAASLLARSGMLGYVVVGVLAFLLGITATALCILLRKKQQNEDRRP